MKLLPSLLELHRAKNINRTFCLVKDEMTKISPDASLVMAIRFYNSDEQVIEHK